MRVALMTCLNPPDDDPDERVLRDGLRAAGVDAHVHAWDDPRFDAREFDVAVLRSTWNYYRTPDRFLSWCDGVSRAARLLNPSDIVRTNAHKSYLKRFADRGLAIVPTAWVAHHHHPDLSHVLTEHGWTDVVVKPAVSAGSWRTKRFRASEAAEGTAFLTEITRDGDAMVQRYIPSVERGGERSIMWIAGEVTHVIIKHPRFAGQPERVELASAPTNHERDMVRIALDGLEDRLLYARLDVMDGERGEPLASELELIEPSLFLREHPPALERFITAIAMVGVR
jgi:glutathione synthase/RimK-type ligase-like ATP-grasp enzyme